MVTNRAPTAAPIHPQGKVLPPRPSSRFLGCLSQAQTQTLYSIVLLTTSMMILSSLTNSLIDFKLEEEEEEEDLINSRNLIQLGLSLSKLLARTALISSLLSLTGTILNRSILQFPLKLQSLLILFLSSFTTVFLGTLYFSPSLMSSASHQLCLFVIRSDSLLSLSTTPDYSSMITNDESISSSQSFIINLLLRWWTSSTHSNPTNPPITTEVYLGENCYERASSFVAPTLYFLIISIFFQIHLLLVLLSPSDEDQVDQQLELPLYHHRPRRHRHHHRRLSSKSSAKSNSPLRPSSPIIPAKLLIL